MEGDSNDRRYHEILLCIDKELGREDLEKLKFLCEVYLGNRIAEGIESGLDLFEALERKDYIKRGHTKRLSTLFVKIGRMDLSSMLPKNDFETDDYDCDQYSEMECFYSLLFDISEELPSHDWNRLRYLYGKVPAKYDIKSGLELFRIMIKQKDLLPNNLCFLEESLKMIDRNDLAKRIPSFSIEYGHIPQLSSNAYTKNVSSNAQQTLTLMSHSMSPDNLQLLSPIPHQDTQGSSNGQWVTPTCNKKDWCQPTACRLMPKKQQEIRASSNAQQQVNPNMQQGIRGSSNAQQQVNPNMQQGIRASSNAQQLVNPNIQQRIRGSFNAQQQVNPNMQQEIRASPSAQQQVNPNMRQEITVSSNAQQQVNPNMRQEIRESSNIFSVTPFIQNGILKSESQQLVQVAVTGHVLGNAELQDRENTHVKTVVESNSHSVAPTHPARSSSGDRTDDVQVTSFSASTANGTRMPASSVNTVVESKSHSFAPTNVSTANGTPMPASSIEENIEQSLAPFSDMNIVASERLCLIIENENFFGQDNVPMKERLVRRRGSHKDTENLKSCFKTLKFNICIHKDLTVTEMKNLLEHFGKRDHTSYDCFVCCIMSHGAEGAVYGTDSLLLPVKSIYSYFNPRVCPSLSGKPKLFFLSFCQGKERTKAIPIPQRLKVYERDGVDPPSETGVTSEPADFLFGLATPPGYASFRDVNDGTIYIKILTENLPKYYKEKHLLDMLLIVNDLMSETALKMGDTEYRQVAAPQFTLRKQVWF